MGAVAVAAERRPLAAALPPSGKGRLLSLAVRTAGFAAAYAVAGLVGRATIVDGEVLSLVWPAAGVAVLWFLAASTRGERLTAALALLVVTCLVNLLTGADLALCAVFGVANLLQVTVVVAVLRRAAPGLWGAGGRGTFTTSSSLTALVLAAAAGSAVGAAAGAVGLVLVADGMDGLQAALWWGRNVTGTLAVTALGHLAAHRLLEHRAPGQPCDPRAAAGQCRRRARARALELVVLVVLSVAAYVGTFLQDGAPLFFPLLALSAWVGLRFAPLTAAAHSVGCGVVAVVLTLRESDHLPQRVTVEVGAGLTQLFVAAVVITAIALAAITQERADTLAATRRAEALTAARGQLWQVAAESMTDGLLVVDGDGTVLTRNSAARALLRGSDEVATRDQAAGWPVELRDLEGNPVPEPDRPWMRACREGYVAPHDVIVLAPQGRPLILSMTATRLDDVAPYGVGPGAVVTFRDVTAERDRTNQLAQFAGVVAHDLRNPLVTLNGWVEIARTTAARRPGDTAALEDALQRAQSAADRMSRLIDDLLHHARSQEDRLDLQVLDLEDLVADAAALHGLADRVRSAHLPTVVADRTLLGQVFRNLLGNSAKYVEPGTPPRIVVTGRRIGDRVLVEVSDNGIGIPEDARDAVFERFSRAHPDRLDVAGTGLGLALVKTVVERHGGTIEVGDGPGGTGCTFRFTVPTADAVGRTPERPRQVMVA